MDTASCGQLIELASLVGAKIDPTYQVRLTILTGIHAELTLIKLLGVVVFGLLFETGVLQRLRPLLEAGGADGNTVA